MTTLNGGRNDIRFNNSAGKCLLENWVEERAVADIDPEDLNADVTNSAQLFRTGHRGLLTTDLDAKPVGTTTTRTAYTPPRGPQVRQKGARLENLEKMLYAQVSAEVHEEFNRPPSPVEYKSVTHDDFNKDDFVPTQPAPTAHHDLTREQPVTFWTEHRDKIHGISQVKTGDTPFRKNTAFSKPIDEYTDQPQPYEHEMIPKM